MTTIIQCVKKLTSALNRFDPDSNFRATIFRKNGYHTQDWLRISVFYLPRGDGFSQERKADANGANGRMGFGNAEHGNMWILPPS
jgi:hypothetical protein